MTPLSSSLASSRGTSLHQRGTAYPYFPLRPVSVQRKALPVRSVVLLLCAGTALSLVALGIQWNTTVTEWNMSQSVWREQSAESQLRSLLQRLGPEPEVPEGWNAGNHTFTDVLPERVCVFSSDNRHILSADEVGLSDPTFIRTKTPEIGYTKYGFSLAFPLNRLWTIRHGYRLSQHDGQAIPGRGGLWNKMMAVKKMTQDRSCDYLVYMDTDAYIRAQEYSLWDMRRRWGIHDGIALALAQDISDADGGWNTGFLIMRNNAVTAGIIDDWINCPDSVPGCDEWNFKHPGDQGVFSHFIMKGLQERDVVAVLPCMEATGNTHLSDLGAGCKGTIVTHNWWYGKQMLAQEAISMTALHMMRLLETI